jgi:hypothetical protein
MTPTEEIVMNIEATPEQESPASQTAEEEWKEFKAAFVAAFAQVKAARSRLAHTSNIAKAQGLANGINHVWGEWV